jgi:hypothetical protein
MQKKKKDVSFIYIVYLAITTFEDAKRSDIERLPHANPSKPSINKQQ